LLLVRSNLQISTDTWHAHIVADFLLMVAGIGCFVSSAITLLVSSKSEFFLCFSFICCDPIYRSSSLVRSLKNKDSEPGMPLHSILRKVKGLAHRHCPTITVIPGRLILQSQLSFIAIPRARERMIIGLLRSVFLAMTSQMSLPYRGRPASVVKTGKEKPVRGITPTLKKTTLRHRSHRTAACLRMSR
jgi:hypothetical protein